MTTQVEIKVPQPDMVKLIMGATVFSQNASLRGTEEVIAVRDSTKIPCEVMQADGCYYLNPKTKRQRSA